MLFLVGSIILTSYLTLSFKVTERLRINTFHAIVFNYITCVVTGSLFNRHFPINSAALQQAWFPWALLMGALFISIFNVIGFTTQQLGVSVASVANKLSLVIPFLFSLYLYNEKVTALKATGIVLALISVYLTVKPEKKETGSKNGQWVFVLPVLLFVGSGLLDTLVKYVQQRFLNGGNNNDFLITAFAGAASVGVVILLIQLITGRKKFEYRAVLAGIAIGFPNYFSIWCLVEVLKQHRSNSSAIIPINNMGIVLFSAVTAWILFKEKLSVINWLGIVLAIGAIALIAFG
ncbi:MAG: EamA family transporter [Bacteroidota bacterium]